MKITIEAEILEVYETYEGAIAANHNELTYRLNDIDLLVVAPNDNSEPKFPCAEYEWACYRVELEKIAETITNGGKILVEL